MNIHTAPLIKIYKPKYLLGFLCLLFFYSNLINCAYAQNKVVKLDKEFSFDSEYILNIASTHTDVVISTWQKNTIKILAYTHGETPDSVTTASNNLWDLQWQKTDTVLTIQTDASKQLQFSDPSINKANASNTYPNNLNDVKAKITSVNQIWHPILQQTHVAEMPEVLKKQLLQSNFNFEAYQNLGETYFKIWEYNLVNNTNRSSSNSDTNSLKELEQWYNQMTKSLLDASGDLFNATAAASSNTTAKAQSPAWSSEAIKRTIEIKVPEYCITNLNANFGTVELQTKLTNFRANLKYTNFTANEIEGEKTNISIAAAPVTIRQWNNGTLNLKYVKKALLNGVGNINLKAVSSKVDILNISESGEFNGSFSQLKINGVDEDISSLSFLNTNGDIELALPAAPFHFAYSGEMSGIKIPPSKLTLKSLGDYRKLMLHGYSQSRNTDTSIQMNVLHSQVLLK